jgi:predicted membrane-bound dolichyl-phosphate-mannose-protein mannosyltransferase
VTPDEPTPVPLPAEEETPGPVGASPKARALARAATSPAAAHVALLLVLLVALLGRVIWLDRPADALIFDEAYYVNAARVMIGIRPPSGTHYADQPSGLDPNKEHPPLGKLIMARTIAIFGDNALGWRLPSLVAGMASILLLYGIVRAAGGGPWLGVLAAGLLAADNLALVHSRIGTLDMMLVAFMLLGAWCYLRGWPLLAGAACALAALTKIGGLYAVLALLMFELLLALWAWRGSRTAPWGALPRVGQLVGAFAVIGIGGLWLLDRRITEFATPWDHIRHIMTYGLALRRDSGPANAESYPWQWLINEVQMSYLRVDESITQGEQIVETRAVINFRGAMNPIIIGAFPLAFGYVLWRVWKKGDVLSLWTMAWIVGTYLPFYPTSIVTQRISYLFYFLPTVPGVAVALSQLLRQSGLPRTVLWTFLLAVAIAFFNYFPFQRPP